MLFKVINIRNGELLEKYHIYKCDICGIGIEESFPRHEEGDRHFCIDCSFKNGFITEKQYLNLSPIQLSNLHAGVDLNGNIQIWRGNKAPPWERLRRGRNSPMDRKWRVDVFERDNYICQKCFQKGGSLEAHHIKPYSEFEKLRHVVSNGITLCKRCHKEEHRQKTKKHMIGGDNNG